MVTGQPEMSSKAHLLLALLSRRVLRSDFNAVDSAADLHLSCTISDPELLTGVSEFSIQGLVMIWSTVSRCTPNHRKISQRKYP